LTLLLVGVKGRIRIEEVGRIDEHCEHFEVGSFAPAIGPANLTTSSGLHDARVPLNLMPGRGAGRTRLHSVRSGLLGGLNSAQARKHGLGLGERNYDHAILIPHYDIARADPNPP
jgi:hypothetical protein